MTEESTSHNHRRSIATLTLGAIGIVFGDIGTSPLYTMRECFHGDHGIAPTPDHVLGVVSLILWALILIVSVKYLCVILRADNEGEGGVLALMTLARGITANQVRDSNLILFVGFFGAALLYGDGMITPAISVLSAIEGLPVAIPSLQPYVMPITLAILVLLFLVQKHGTGKIGAAFGPIIFVWFVTLGVLGSFQVFKHPIVFEALIPWFALKYLAREGWSGFVVVSSVFLAVTGAEALYADMGHYGKKPIRIAWFFLALPALALNYLGQASLILENPTAAENPFFLLAPSWFLFPLIILATLATTIASQALISGAFSMTSQAIQLGYLPRMQVFHTSSQNIGQIYIPTINYLLLACVLIMVLGFGSSKNMAAAYGIAVSLTMLLTTYLVYLVMRVRWNWSRFRTLSVVGLFLVIEGAFFMGNALKFLHGGWVPIAIATFIFVLMSTWRQGRKILSEKLKSHSVPFYEFFKAIRHDSPNRVAGTAVFMSRNPDGVPPALLHNLRHNKVLHERIVFLTVVTKRVPYVPLEERAIVERLQIGFFKLTLQFGFMEKPLLPNALKCAVPLGLKIDPHETAFFLGAETVLPCNDNQGMAPWREHLFALMVRNAQKASNFFGLPPQQVVEVGLQMEI